MNFLVTLPVEILIGVLLLLVFGAPPIVVRIVAAFSGAPPPLSVAPHEGRLCPYCKDALAEKGVHVECATCGTWHHATCFEENDGCSVFGCREKRGKGRVAERT